MLREIARVGFMTGPAGPALLRLVDMREMEVLISVPEVGQFSRLGIEDNRFFMAAETEVIVVHQKGHIKRRRIRVSQYSEIG